MAWVQHGAQRCGHDPSAQGSPDQSPSTYWIDATLQRLDALQTASRDGYVMGGNESQLLREGDQVVAHSIYELFENERMPAAAFRAVLEGWRDEVLRAHAEGRVKVAPETYRRGPLCLHLVSRVGHPRNSAGQSFGQTLCSDSLWRGMGHECTAEHQP